MNLLCLWEETFISCGWTAVLLVLRSLDLDWMMSQFSYFSSLNLADQETAKPPWFQGPIFLHPALLTMRNWRKWRKPAKHMCSFTHCFLVVNEVWLLLRRGLLCHSGEDKGSLPKEIVAPPETVAMLLVPKKLGDTEWRTGKEAHCISKEWLKFSNLLELKSEDHEYTKIFKGRGNWGA